MTKNYYRSDYSDKQWKALIDKAMELGCQITYSKYGNIVTIDSTDRENSILKSVGAGEERRAMNSKRTYTYNVVLQENDVCPWGELLTDKELERMKLHNPKRDWPKTAKAKVYAESCYISFGVRFGRVKQYLNTGK